jgi:hypothetical protein
VRWDEEWGEKSISLRSRCSTGVFVKAWMGREEKVYRYAMVILLLYYGLLDSDRELDGWYSLGVFVPPRIFPILILLLSCFFSL